MGNLENETKREFRATKVRLAVLGTIKAAGLIAVAMTAPKAASLLAKSMTKSKQNSTYNVIRRLTSAGLIEFQDTFVRLTPAGERFLSKSVAKPVERPRRWDRKWRVVIFDIPESKKRLRNRLRDTLLRLEFIRLQNSVWVHPYDHEDLIALLKADFKIGKNVLYMIVDKIENDAPLRKHFRL